MTELIDFDTRHSFQIGEKFSVEHNCLEAVSALPILKLMSFLDLNQSNCAQVTDDPM
jgi:hypothetical protein